MLFKAFSRYIHIFIVATLFVGCSYFFDEKVKETEVTYSREAGACISEVNPIISSYFSKTPSVPVNEAAIDAFEECYDTTIQTLVTHTRSGRLESEDYSPENFELLIKRFNVKSAMSLDDIASFMRLKAFLMGGDQRSISRDELIEIQKALPIFTQFLRDLLPHRSVIFRHADLSWTTQDLERFRAAFGQLKLSQDLILNWLEGFRGRRQETLSFVSSFLISQFFSEEWGQNEDLTHLIVQFKNFVLDGEGEGIERERLSLFVQQVVGSYHALAQFEYFLQGDDPNSLFTNVGHIFSFLTRLPQQAMDCSQFKGVGLASLKDLMDLFAEVLGRAINDRSNKKIPFNRLRDVLRALQQVGYLSGPLTADTLSDFLQGLSTRYVAPHAPHETAFTRDKVDDIQGLFNYWMMRQETLNRAFAEQDSLDLSRDSTNRQSLFSEYAYQTQWMTLLDQLNTHQWDDQARVLFSADQSDFSYEELTITNSLSLLVELFMRPYNSGKSDFLTYAIGEQDSQDIYELMRGLGVEMQFMDARADDSGLRAFMESNNFSTQRRNDEDMDFMEVYEFIASSVSAGHIADRLYSDLPERCFYDYGGSLGRRVMKDDCVRSFLSRHFTRYFDHLPDVVSYWNHSSREDRQEFMRNVELSARAGIMRDKPFDLNEIRVAVSIVAYVQSIFFTFDFDRNGLANGNSEDSEDSELRQAEQHFRPFIAGLLEQHQPTLIQDHRVHIERICGEGQSDQQLLNCLLPKIFIHLLREGELPMSGCSIARFVRPFLGDAISSLFGGVTGRQRDSFEVRFYKETEATPGNVVVVFATLAKMNRDSHIERIERFLTRNHSGLFRSLQGTKAPNCQRENPSIFCRWSRSLYCTGQVQQDLFDYFRDNKYNLFERDTYRSDLDEAVNETLIQLNNTFRRHRLFSTQCSFPLVDHLENSAFYNRATETIESCRLRSSHPNDPFWDNYVSP
jgi:hypothetical protein